MTFNEYLVVHFALATGVLLCTSIVLIFVNKMSEDRAVGMWIILAFIPVANAIQMAFILFVLLTPARTRRKGKDRPPPGAP